MTITRGYEITWDLDTKIRLTAQLVSHWDSRRTLAHSETKWA